MVAETRATVVTLQQTKLANFDQAIVAETLGVKFANQFVFLPATGTCGGILLAVDEDHYTIELLELGIHTVTAKLTCASFLNEPARDCANFIDRAEYLQTG